MALLQGELSRQCTAVTEGLSPQYYPNSGKTIPSWIKAKAAG